MVKVLALCLLLVGLSAHELAVARAVLIEEGPDRYRLDCLIPQSAGTMAVPELPSRFHVTSPEVQRQGGWIRQRLAFEGGGQGLTVDDVLHFPWPHVGVFVTVRWRDGGTTGQFHAGDRGGVTVAMAGLEPRASRPLTRVLGSYAMLGLEHILLGVDHLAFVLCLCLLTSGWRLLGLITGFTVGHSLTLALAICGMVNLPAAPVEACIAWSIVVVARLAWLRQRDEAEIGRGHGLALTAVFGLLHGLGFAGALATAGIASSERLAGLLAFNVGVEVGQVIFVGAVLAVLAATRRWLPRLPVATGLAWAAGSAGCYWVLIRLS